jgi:hypothetical protein
MKKTESKTEEKVEAVENVDKLSRDNEAYQEPEIIIADNGMDGSHRILTCRNWHSGFTHYSQIISSYKSDGEYKVISVSLDKNEARELIKELAKII